MTERRLCYTRGQLDMSAMTDDGPLRFTASTTGVNRYGFSLRHEGWLLDNYARNPVFMWMHDLSIPAIGTSRTARENGELACYVTFDREDAFAASIERKYRRGFMSAVSVGWDFVDEAGLPIADWWRLSAERARDEAFYDLTEISAVPVPGDPRALKERGLSLLGKQMVDLLDEQEYGQSTADQVRAALRDELAALGIDLAALKPEPEHKPPVTGIDRDAAEAVLAAFHIGEEKAP